MKSLYYLEKSPVEIEEIYTYDLRLYDEPNIMSGIKIPHIIIIVALTIILLTLLMLFAPFPYIVSYLIAFLFVIAITYFILNHNKYDFLAYLFVFVEDTNGNFYLVYNENQEPIAGPMLKRYFDENEYLGDFLNEKQAYEKVLNSDRYLEGVNVRIIKKATLLKQKKQLVCLDIREKDHESNKFLDGKLNMIISPKYKNSKQLFNHLLKNSNH